MQNEEMWEFETLSIFLTNNPFKGIEKYINPYNECEDGNQCVIVGVISQIVTKKNKLKQQYVFMNVCTSYGLVQVACWASQYKTYQDIIKRGERISILAYKNNGSYSVIKMKTYNQWKLDRGIK